MSSTEVVAAVIDALNRSGLPYMLVGSLSSNLYGIPRLTKDADFVLQLGSMARRTSSSGCSYPPSNSSPRERLLR